jgi:RNA polymerase sigma factor (sigma-70 family)
MDDHDLLRQFVAARSEAAFAELVQRHLALVYSTCLRQLRDAHLAEDVTQAVFVLLAQKAAGLNERVVIAGWLMKTARFCCNNARAKQHNRVTHEKRIAQMRENSDQPDAAWSEIEGLLDDSIDQLSPALRDAVLLRFFEHRSVKEIARELKITEYAAEKRVNDGLAKLRRQLVKKGVTIGAMALAAGLTEQAVRAAPAKLASSIVAAACFKQTTGQATRILSQVKKAKALARLRTALAGMAMLGACIMSANAMGWHGSTDHIPSSPHAAPALAEKDAAIFDALRAARDALVALDPKRIDLTCRFTDETATPAEWNALAELLQAKRDVQRALRQHFPLEATRDLEPVTLGDQIAALVPTIDFRRVTVDQQGDRAAVRFVFQDARHAGGTIYLRRDGGHWKVDVTRSFVVSVVEPSAKNEWSAATARAMGDRAERLNAIAARIRSHELGDLDAVQAALHSAAALTPTDVRFVVRLRCDEVGNARRDGGGTLEP